MEVVKCKVKGCDNDSDHGQMVNGVCFPCDDFITNGRGTNNQVFRNASNLFVRRFAEDVTSVSLALGQAHSSLKHMVELLKGTL